MKSAACHPSVLGRVGQEGRRRAAASTTRGQSGKKTCNMMSRVLAQSLVLDSGSMNIDQRFGRRGDCVANLFFAVRRVDKEA